MSGGALRAVFAAFGVQFDSTQLEQGDQAIQGVIGRLHTLGGLIAGSALVQGVRDFANEFEEAAGRLQDTSDQLGTTTTELQELQFAATAAGLSTEQSGGAFARFQQQVAGAAQGAHGPAAAFRALGVSVRDSNGEVGTTSDLMDGVARGFAGITDPARRAQLAQELFGRSGARLANIMHDGEGGLAALREEFAQYGGMSAEAIETANAYGDATDRLAVASLGLKSIVATHVLPILTWLVTKANQGAMIFMRLSRETHVLKAGMIVLGAASAAAGARTFLAWLPVAAEFLAITAALLLLTLVVDDLWTMWEGGDSVIGRVLDSLGKVGTRARFIQMVRDGVEGMKLAWHEAGEEVDQGKKRVGDFIRSVTGFFGLVREDVIAVGSWITGVFDGVGADIEGVFGRAAGWFEETFGVSIERIKARIREMIGTVTAPLARLGTALHIPQLAGLVTNAVSEAGSTVRRGMSFAAFGGAPQAIGQLGDLGRGIGGVLRDARDEWGDVFSGTNAPLAPTTPAGGPRTVTTTTTNHTTIRVDGARDPSATADEIERRQRQTQRAQRDARHPEGGTR